VAVTVVNPARIVCKFSMFSLLCRTVTANN